MGMPGRSSSLAVGIGALAFAGALSGGCSVIFHVDGSQCSTSGDCTSRGAAFTQYTCIKGSCIPPVMVMSEAGTDSGFQCTVNTDCTPTGTHTDVACDVTTHTCLQLTTDDCPVIIPGGDSISSTTLPPVFFGTFGVIPPSGPLTYPTTLNYQLALQEFANLGIPTGPGVGKRTPVAIECNADGDTDAINRAMDHLINDVHVTSVVAALPSTTLNQVFTKYDINQNANIFFINPLSADSTLVPPSLTTNGLLWHMLGQPGDVTPAYAAFMPLVENHIRNTAPWNLGSSAPLRVAVATANATATNDLAAAVKKVLTWNGGKNVTQNTASGNYMEVELTQSILNGVPYSSIDNTAEAQMIADFQPHVIISFASEEFVRLLANIEIDWTGTQLPFYLVSPYNQGSTNLQNAFPTYNYATPGTESPQSLRVRTAGIGVASTTDAQVLNDYESRFKGAYPTRPDALGQENYYDAMYFAIYATVAAGRQPMIGGSDLAGGMKHLISLTGPQYSVGPADQGSIFGVLGSGGSMGLTGTLGPPNFDTATSSRIGAGSVYCVQYTPDAGMPYPYVYDVLTLSGAPGSADAGAFAGTFPCFSGLQ
jgi:hypothetical protein